MRKKLSTQIEKREREILETKEEEICDEKENDFLTVHCSEVQYIYMYTEISYGLIRDP